MLTVIGVFIITYGILNLVGVTEIHPFNQAAVFLSFVLSLLTIASGVYLLQY